MKRTYAVLLSGLVVMATAMVAGQSGSGLTSDLFKGLPVRSLGPSLTTGRVADVAVDPKNASVWYVASAAGGVWKTENRGQTFRPIFDEGGSFNMCCIVVDPKDSNVLWLGTGENSNPRSAMYGDGVYKSVDAGASWSRVGFENSEHIGNIKIDPRNSNVVYVAAQGPLWAAGGDRGLFKTTDGGKTWKSLIEHSPDTGANEVQIDPTNPDVLYASLYQRRRSLGQFIGGGPEGGIYKSTNAGATWTKMTKGVPANVGRIALGVDPKAKPTRVYALIDAVGAEQAFYRSDDAGVTWTRTGQPGADVINPGVAPATPAANAARGARGGARGGNVAGAGAAGVGAAGAGAAGAGAAGAGANQGRGGGGRGAGGGGANPAGQDPHYYYEIFVDPVRPDTVWCEGLNLYRSEDGGKTFHVVTMQYNSAIHVDFHAIAFDVNDRNHLIFGNDGGLYETWDDGKNVRHFDNLPISQFYRIAVDNALPFYHVCGGLQDNNSMCGPARTVNAYGIRTGDWYLVGGGDGFQPRIDPDDPSIVYATSQFCGLQRLDLKTSQAKSIRPGAFSSGNAPTTTAREGGPAAAGGRGAGGGGGRGGGTERVNWDCPYMVSPHSHTRLYIGGERVYRSDDRGDTWTPISPDLTRDLDPRVIPIMGKVWEPETTVSYNRSTTQMSTIVSIDESPLLDGLIYIGTDDGLVQVTEDGGQTWRKTDKFPGVPDGTYVTDVFASPRDANVVFVTFGNHQHADFKPYVLKSTDRGKSFTSITGDLPATRNNLWTVVQDHGDSNLLFVGGEFGLFVTVDGGAHWVQYKAGLPTIQVRDLQIQKRENDLVIGTFGRGIYVLDDYSALRGIGADMLSQDARVLPVRTTYAFNEYRLDQASTPMVETPNPPVGALVSYFVGSAANSHLVLTITDSTGKQIRRLDPIDTSAGLHRAVWNLRPDPPAPAPGAAPAGGGRGGGGGFGGRGQLPMVDPGRYTATLGKLDGDKVTPIGKQQSFEVVPLPGK